MTGCFWNFGIVEFWNTERLVLGGVSIYIYIAYIYMCIYTCAYIHMCTYVYKFMYGNVCCSVPGTHLRTSLQNAIGAGCGKVKSRAEALDVSNASRILRPGHCGCLQDFASCMLLAQVEGLNPEILYQ